MTKFGTLAAALLLSFLIVGCGGSSSPREELSRFVVDYVDQNQGNCCETGWHAKVARITFARSNPNWAIVAMSITLNGHPDGTEYLVAHRIDSTWQVVGFGKGSIGCHVPPRIRTELARGAPDGALDCSTE